MQLSSPLELLSSWSAVDLVLLLVLAVAAFSGWRQGAVSSVLSLIGEIAGLICALGLAPVVMRSTDSQGLRVLVVLGVFFLMLSIGNLVGNYVGSALRYRFRLRRSLRIDSACGALLQSFVALLVLWLVATPVIASLAPEQSATAEAENSAAATSGPTQRLSLLAPVGAALAKSQILGAVDAAAPAALAQLPTKLAATLSDSGLPPLISPFTRGAAVEVPAPAPMIADQELVARLRPAVVHVQGDASACARRLLGSGFVVAPDVIITNAHVVAGASTVRVETVLGVKEASVVHYDPQEDIAVLRSAGLGLPTLPWASRPADSGDDAIVVGFPSNSPFEAAPARVRDRITINGPDIYATTRLDREAYTVRGQIRQGNSGGPMVNMSGEVLGVVFGAAADHTDTGYVLTAAEVKNSLGVALTNRSPVPTGECVAR